MPQYSVHSMPRDVDSVEGTVSLIEQRGTGACARVLTDIGEVIDVELPEAEVVRLGLAEGRTVYLTVSEYPVDR